MTNQPRRRRILYVGNMGEGNTSMYRFHAFERLGQDVSAFDPADFEPSSALLSKIRFRLPVGPLISAVNRGLLKAVQEAQPEIVWMDKPTTFTPATMRKIKRTGALTVCYNQDNPFGPRHDPGWMQFYNIYRMFDLHCLLRYSDVPRYEAWGLPYIKVLLSFDPLMHFPPPPEWTGADRIHDLSYTGSPYEDRPQFLRILAEQYGLPVSVAGPNWNKVFTPALMRKYCVAGMLKDAAYRENIWRSKINIAFITLKNEEDVSHKAFEIAACGGFLLALRSPGHLACFEEDKEAVFFSSIKECAEKAQYYLQHQELRQAIAARGRERALLSGYDNDTQLAGALLRLEEIEAGGSAHAATDRRPASV